MNANRPASDHIGARWQAARQCMAAAGLDGLLVTEKLNYWYMSGHRSPEFDKKVRPLVFVLPLHGAPWLVAPRSDAAGLQATCPQAELLIYADMPFPAGLLTDAVRGAGLGGARIGAEFGNDERLGLSMAQLDELRAALPGMGLVSFGPLLSRLRMVKDAHEIAEVRRACRISLNAWREAVTLFRPGMTNAGAAAVLGAALCRAGHDFNTPGHVTAGNGVAGIAPYGAGDVLWSDFGATSGGYQADLSRRAVFGPASATHRATHAQICAVLDAMIAVIRPGARACDIAVIADAMLTDAGYPPLGGRRAGHGLGLSAGEGPSLALHDTTVLQAGMILTPEPGAMLPSGEVIHIEETVLVTADGCERLTTGAHVLAEIPC